MIHKAIALNAKFTVEVEPKARSTLTLLCTSRLIFLRQLKIIKRAQHKFLSTLSKKGARGSFGNK